MTFQDEKLMKNKEKVHEVSHNRPCFFSFKDEKTSLYWLIPISSKVEKYKAIYNKKILRFGKCDTLTFGEVLGRKAAFLIQNMCPIIPKYINEEFIDKISLLPVRVSGNIEKDVIKKAKKVLNLYHNGVDLIFPNVGMIEKQLLAELSIEKIKSKSNEISLSKRLLIAKEKTLDYKERKYVNKNIGIEK
jgi:hypothetical protein